MKYYSAMKIKEILPFLTMWINPEGILLSEIRQMEKDKCCMISYVKSLKKKSVNKTKQKQTHRYREQVDGCQRGEGWQMGEKKTQWKKKEKYCDSTATLHITGNLSTFQKESLWGMQTIELFFRPLLSPNWCFISGRLIIIITDGIIFKC